MPFTNVSLFKVFIFILKVFSFNEGIFNLEYLKTYSFVQKN